MNTNISLKGFKRHVDGGDIIFSDDYVSLVDARLEESQNKPGRKVLWTDASALRTNSVLHNNAVGIAVVWRQNFSEELQNHANPGEQEWVEYYRRSELATDSGSGEQEAAYVGLEKGEGLFEPNTTGVIVLYMDADMGAIRKPQSDNGWLRSHGNFATKTAIRAVELARKGFKIEFKACAGHGSILGNVLADYWARKAISLHRPTSSTEDWELAREEVEKRDRRRMTLQQTATEKLDADFEEFEKWMSLRE